MALPPTRKPRPRLAVPFSTRVQTKWTDAQYTILKQQAEVCGVTVSTYVRNRCLGVEMRAKADLALIRTLDRQAGLLKYLVMEHPEHRDQINEAFDVLKQLYRDNLLAQKGKH